MTSHRLTSLQRRPNSSPSSPPAPLPGNASPLPARLALGETRLEGDQKSREFQQGISLLRVPRAVPGKGTKRKARDGEQKNSKSRSPGARASGGGRRPTAGKKRKPSALPSKKKRTKQKKLLSIRMSPVQAMQECIAQKSKMEGARNWGQIRELVRYPTDTKPPPCPCCGNTDARMVSESLSVAWSCRDCGEEYGYPSHASPLLRIIHPSSRHYAPGSAPGPRPSRSPGISGRGVQIIPSLSIGPAART